MAMRRTNIEIDEVNIEKVKKITHTKTVKDAVNTALAELIRIEQQRTILSHRGMGGWEGSLNDMRRDR